MSEHVHLRRNRAAVCAVVALLLVPVVGVSPAAATSGTLWLDKSTTLTEHHHGNVVIGADNVTLDCAGHTILGPDAGGMSGGIEIGAYKGVVIRRCVVSSFNVNGIHADGPVGILLEKNTLVGNSIHLHAAQGGLLKDNLLRDMPGVGIQFTASNGVRVEGATARNCAVAGTSIAQGTTGVTVKGMFASGGWAGFVIDGSSDTVLDGNVATGNDTGILVTNVSPGTTLAGNTASGNQQGIVVNGGSNGATLTGNTANQNKFVGIDVGESSSATVANNTSSLNGAEGFVVRATSGSVVAGNTANQNVGSGFLIEGSTDSKLTDNTASGNGIAGFWIRYASDRNLVARNTAANNFEGFVVEAAGNNGFTANVANSNRNTGFWVRVRSSDNVFEKNVARQNGTIDAYDDGSGLGNTWTDNKFGKTFGIN